MPGNEVEDGINNLHKLDNSLSQAVTGNWPVLDCNQQVGKPIHSESVPNFNWKTYNVQQLDIVTRYGGESISVPFNQNYTQLTPQQEYSRSLVINNQLNTNDFLLGFQNFQSKQNKPCYFSNSPGYDQQNLISRGFSISKSQQENECADSPTLTTNSERSEITEASSDFTFFTGQQQLVTDHQLVTPQPHLMQQSGYNEMHLLQQQMMFKQLQELQRQQQLQQLGDVRQQNSLNQLSAFAKQATGGQYSPLINGKPIHDASQMFRNWMNGGASPTMQGLPNKVMFSQEQGQAVRSMGLASQQLDASLYGTPISNTRGNMSQHAHLQGVSHDSVNLLTKASGQAQKSMMKSSGFGIPYLGDQSTVPTELVGLPQGASMSKQGLQMKNNFAQASVRGLNSGAFPGNLHENNSMQANASVKELNGSQEQAGWPPMQQTAKQLGPSQGLVPLDPMEAKILYNMDDNIWESFGGRLDTSGAGFGHALEHLDSSNAIPSIQSGSWSALMQSAVAEASSSDTGQQEDWSGLTFQNMEQSTDNQISNFVDTEKQQTSWLDNKLQSASSFSSRPFPIITDSGMSNSFPGFHQSDIQLSVEQREDTCHDGSHASFENYNPKQKPSVEDGQKVQTIMRSGSAWTGQIFEHPQSDTRHQRVASSDISSDKKGKESMRKSEHQISNGPLVEHSSYEGANGIYDKQNCYQRDNSNDSHTSNGVSGYGLGSFEQLKPFGNVCGSVMNMDKGSSLDFQGNLRTSEEVRSRGDLASTPSSFQASAFPDGSDVTAPTSEHMLELLHKVDQSRDNSTIAQFGYTDPNPQSEVPGADACDASVSQLYSQSSAAQGFGLMLAPPSQRLPNSNNSPSPRVLPHTFINLNSRQDNPEVGEKNQTWLDPSSSFQSIRPSHEFSQRGPWDDESDASGQAGYSSYLNVQGNAIASFTSNPPHERNRLQMHSISNMPVTSQSLQTNLSGAVSRYPTFNQALSQDTSQQFQTNHMSQQFPVLEALPASQPSNVRGMSQQGEVSARPHNVWRTVPTRKQPFSMESLKFPSSLPSSMDPSTNSMASTSQVPHESNDQNSVKGRYNSSEFAASSNSQGSDYGEEHPWKETSQRQMSSKMLHASQSFDVSLGRERVSDAADLTSGLLVSHSHQQHLDRIRHNNQLAPGSSEGILETSSHSHNHHKYSLLHQMRATNKGEDSVSEVQKATFLGGQQLHDDSSTFRHPVYGVPNSASQPNTLSSGDTKMLGSMAEAGDGPRLKASLRSSLEGGSSQQMVICGHGDSQTKSSSSNVPSNHTDHSQVNLHMAPSWFKQYFTLRNGQTVPMFDARLPQTAASQFSLEKPSQNLLINASLFGHLDAANTVQGGRDWPTAAATLAASQHRSVPYMLPSEATDQMVIMRLKKRKLMTTELPWHKEVTQDSKRLHSISDSEQDWAQATNRLIEKVEGEVEMIEDVHPVLQSKRRLVLTTQLMQQLFRPAPASVFSADAASNFDTVSYFVSRLSMGDSCGLAYCTRNDLLVAKNNGDMNSEKFKTSEKGGDLKYLEVLEEFIDRSKKLENDFLRLDKTASVVDIRVEFEELERFSVINRFAKFHVRGHSDTSGSLSSSGTPKPIPQRYVTAFPMPRILPEGAQCLSL